MNRHPAPPLPGWLQELLPFERYVVDVGEQRMHVMECGQGQPVLMLHGNPTWGFLWRKVATALMGAPVRCIMPDLVGLGLSSKPRSLTAHTLEAHAGWLGELVDALQLDDVVFVGQDWGGPIGLRALAERKERVHGLVLLNTVVSPPREGFRASFFHRFAQMPVVSDVVFRGLAFPQCVLASVQGERASIRGRVADAYRWPLRGWENNAAPLALARMVPDGPKPPVDTRVAGVPRLRASVLGSRRAGVGRARPDPGAGPGLGAQTASAGQRDADARRTLPAGGGAPGDCPRHPRDDVKARRRMQETVPVRLPGL
ncbi:MAG: alpha/beta fold hydrolase [Myxococcota bacterium]